MDRRPEVDDIVQIKDSSLLARVTSVNGDCLTLSPLNVYEPWPEETGIVCEFTIDDVVLLAFEKDTLAALNE